MVLARQKKAKTRMRLFGALAQSRGWEMAYRAVAAATLIFLLGAVSEKAVQDSAGAQLLFKLVQAGFGRPGRRADLLSSPPADRAGIDRLRAHPGLDAYSSN
jgi:hypothetical protein